jgi:hypothetical protein
MNIVIHNREFFVKNCDFPIISGNEFKPLKVKRDIAELDREISFLKEVANILDLEKKTIINIGSACRGYVPINLLNDYTNITVIDKKDDYLTHNLTVHDFDNKIKCKKSVLLQNTYVVRIEPKINISKVGGLIMVADADINIFEKDDNYISFKFNNRIVFVHNTIHDKFLFHFRNYIHGNVLNYDNLIHFLIMVKNGGESFRKVLIENLPYIDRWSILDTGSTDNTISIIKDVLKNKDGQLYQEPFINFKYSRNRLLDLAGSSCVFNVMIDDTYIIRGDLREFLNYVRADDVADSYSLYIKESDMTYSSNRITKTEKNLRYVYKIHEIIETNYSVSIPSGNAYIEDLPSEYMNNRTLNRKEKDIEWLYEEIEEKPDDPRNYYYLAETYLCIKEWKQAFDWYKKRATHPKNGYNEEKYDALYKMAVMADLYLGVSWEKCQQLYLDAFIYDPKRAESMFQLGVHYNTISDDLEYLYLKKSYEIGLPRNHNMNIKTDMYNMHLPKQLLPLCYKFENYELGEQAAQRLYKYKNETDGAYWLSVFYLLNQNKQYMENVQIVKTKLLNDSKKEIIVFVIGGGWDEWYGKTLYDRGLGGSETFVVRFAEYLEKDYNVLVFCKCGSDTKIWNGVYYFPLEYYSQYISTINIKVCFINRYPEYIPVTVKNNVKCYLILHDLFRKGERIENDDNLKGVICLSEWHRQQFNEEFPILANKSSTLSYGIDLKSFPKKQLKKHSFIFPSFPNRGLIHLLKMFPKITERYPDATLNVFVNFKLHWLQNNFGLLMKEIELLIDSQPNVINHGWVNGETLRKYWSTAHVWLYTCDFKETCCLVGFEAAASKTIAVTSDLGALVETVGNRGTMIPGDARTQEWQNKAFEKVCDIFDSKIESKTIAITSDLGSLVEPSDGYTRTQEWHIFDSKIEADVWRNYCWSRTKCYSLVVKDFEKKYIYNS